MFNIKCIWIFGVLLAVLVVQHVSHVAAASTAEVSGSFWGDANAEVNTHFASTNDDSLDDHEGGPRNSNSFTKQFEIDALMDDNAADDDDDDEEDDDADDIDAIDSFDMMKQEKGSKAISFSSRSKGAEAADRKPKHKLGVHAGIDFDAYANDFNLQDDAVVAAEATNQKSSNVGMKQTRESAAANEPNDMQYDDETEGADIILESQGSTSKNFTTFLSRNKHQDSQNDKEAKKSLLGKPEGQQTDITKTKNEESENKLEMKANHKKSTFTTMTVDKIKSKAIRNFFEEHFRKNQQQQQQQEQEQEQQQQQQQTEANLNEQADEQQQGNSNEKLIREKPSYQNDKPGKREGNMNNNFGIDGQTPIESSGEETALNDIHPKTEAPFDEDSEFEDVNQEHGESKANLQPFASQIPNQLAIPVRSQMENQQDWYAGKSNIETVSSLKQQKTQTENQHQLHSPYQTHRRLPHHHHHYQQQQQHQHQYRHYPSDQEKQTANDGHRLEDPEVEMHASNSLLQKKSKRNHNLASLDVDVDKEQTFGLRNRYYGQQQHDQDSHRPMMHYYYPKWQTQKLLRNTNNPDTPLSEKVERAQTPSAQSIDEIPNENEDIDEAFNSSDGFEGNVDSNDGAGGHQLKNLNSEVQHSVAVGQQESQFDEQNFFGETINIDTSTTATTTTTSSSTTTTTTTTTTEAPSPWEKSDAYGDSFNSNGLINIKAVTEGPGASANSYEFGSYGYGNNDENSPIQVVAIRARRISKVTPAAEQQTPTVSSMTTMEPINTEANNNDNNQIAVDGPLAATKGPTESHSNFEYHKAMRRNNKRYGHKSHKKRYKDYLRYKVIKGKRITSTSTAAPTTDTPTPPATPKLHSLSSQMPAALDTFNGKEMQKADKVNAMDTDWLQDGSKVQANGEDKVDNLSSADRLNVKTVQSLLASNKATPVASMEKDEKNEINPLQEEQQQQQQQQPVMKKLTIKLTGNVVDDKPTNGQPASPIFAVNNNKKDQRKYQYSEGQLNYYIHNNNNNNRNSNSDQMKEKDANAMLRNGVKANNDLDSYQHRHHHHHNQHHQHFHHSRNNDGQFDEPYTVHHLNHRQRPHHLMKHHQGLRHNPYQRRFRTNSAGSRKMPAKEDAVHELGHQITEMDELERYYAKWPHLARVQFQVYDEHFHEAHPDFYPEYEYETIEEIDSAEAKMPPYVRKYNRRNKQLLDLLEGTIATPSRPPPLRAWSNSKLQPGPKDTSAATTIVHIDNEFMQRRKLNANPNPFEQQIKEKDQTIGKGKEFAFNKDGNLKRSEVVESKNSSESLNSNQIPDEDMSLSLEQNDEPNANQDKTFWSKKVQQNSFALQSSSDFVFENERQEKNEPDFMATTVKPVTSTYKSALYRLPSYPAFAGNYYGKTRSRTAQIMPHNDQHFMRLTYHSNTNDEEPKQQEEQANHQKNTNDNENIVRNQMRNIPQTQQQQTNSSNNQDNKKGSAFTSSNLPAITAAALPAGANKLKSVNSFIYHRVIDSTPRLLGSGAGSVPGRKQLLPFVAITDRRLETSKKTALQLEKDFEQNYFPMP